MLYCLIYDLYALNIFWHLFSRSICVLLGYSVFSLYFPVGLGRSDVSYILLEYTHGKGLLCLLRSWPAGWFLIYISIVYQMYNCDTKKCKIWSFIRKKITTVMDRSLGHPHSMGQGAFLASTKVNVPLFWVEYISNTILNLHRKSHKITSKGSWLIRERVYFGLKTIS